MQFQGIVGKVVAIFVPVIHNLLRVDWTELFEGHVIYAENERGCLGNSQIEKCLEKNGCPRARE